MSWGCPICKQEDEVDQIDTLSGKVLLEGFDADGQAIFTGDTEVEWDSSTFESFYCGRCDLSFSKPVQVPDE